MDGKHGHGRASSLNLRVSRIETSIVSRWYLLVMYSCHNSLRGRFAMWVDLVKGPEEAHLSTTEKFLQHTNIDVDVQRV